MFRLDRKAAIFAANTFAASMPALSIALALNLPRPFWAMITAFITSQPFSAAVRSKAVYRLCGTVGGAVAAVVLVPNLVNAPALLSIAMALWVAVCLGISLLDRTPRSYGFMLAGYTAAIIGFASVGTPDQIFATAVARAEEISLGAISASLFHDLFFPASLTPSLTGKFKRMLRDTERWMGAILTRAPGATDGYRRQAAEATDLFLSSTHLPYAAGAGQNEARALLAVQDRLITLIPLMSSIADRLGAISDPPPAMTAFLARVAHWVQTPGDNRDDAAQLIREARELGQESAGPDWQAMLATNLYDRIAEAVDWLQACRDLDGFIGHPRQSPPRHVAALLGRAHRRSLHRDPLLALRSAVAAFIAVIVACTFWIVSAWSDGGTAAMMAAVFSCLFASQDDPRPGLRSMAVYIILSIPLAGIINFVVLPKISGFPTLVLALAPFLLTIGYCMARPRMAANAMGVMIGFIGGIAIQSAYSADFGSFINANIAQMIGLFIALVVTSLCRVVAAAAAAKRLARLTELDLAALARRRNPPAFAAWISRMVDREGLLQARLAQISAQNGEPDAALPQIDLLADLRTGVNILTLNRVRRTLPSASAINELLAQLARYFPLRRRKNRPDAALLSAIDRSLVQLTIQTRPLPADQREGIAALVGLRRSLFAQSPGFTMPEGQP